MIGNLRTDLVLPQGVYQGVDSQPFADHIKNSLTSRNMTKWNVCHGCNHPLMDHLHGVCEVYPCLCVRQRHQKARTELFQMEALA